MQYFSSKIQSDSKLSNLASIHTGRQVQLVAINAGRSLQGRLLSMGLIRGAEIQMIANQGSGPLLVGLGKSRMTLGRGMAEKIIVK